MKEIRAVRPDEVSVRLKQCFDGKGLFLLYIDSRACRKILDETFGVLGWRNSFREIKGVLYCTIEIWDNDKKLWVAKEDCGTQSATEKEKGEASDAFKRACFNLGIARELYTKIKIFIPIKTESKEVNGRTVYYPKNKFQTFRIARIEANKSAQKINYISIVDGHEVEVFDWGMSALKMPYINAEVEKAYNTLLLECERNSILTNKRVGRILLEAMDGYEYSAAGCAEAYIKLKQETEKLRKGAEVGAENAEN